MKKYLCLSLGLLMSAPILQCSSARVTTGTQASKEIQGASYDTIQKIFDEGGSLALFPLGITSVDEARVKPEEKNLYATYLVIMGLAPFGETDLKKLKVGEKPLREFLATKLSYKNLDEAKADAWSFNEANIFKRGEIVLVERSNGSIEYGVICIQFKGSRFPKYLVQLPSITDTKEMYPKSIGKKITMASI